MFYQIVMLLMTLDDPKSPKPLQFIILHFLLYICDGQTSDLVDKFNHSKFQPTDDKPSLKGAWSCDLTHFKYLVLINISGTAKAKD